MSEQGQKPRIKVTIKGKSEGAKNVSLIAAWDRDGKLSASLDRNVVELAAKMADGTIVRVKRDAEGKPDHWINMYEEKGGERPAAAKPTTPEPSIDDFGTDSIPF